MPQEWTANVVARMHLAKVTTKRLAEESGYILKPFFNDWGQMHLFERAVLQQMHLENEYMTRSAFPSALGAVLDKADTYTALFGEAEMLAERLFVREKKPECVCAVGEFRVSGGYGMDSYEEVAAEDRIIELAGLIETLGSGAPFTYGPGDFNYKQLYQARNQIGSVGPADSDALFVCL